MNERYINAMKAASAILALSTAIALGPASIASASQPSKSQIRFKQGEATTSGLVSDGCLVYNFMFRGFESMSKVGGDLPEHVTGATVGLVIFDTCEDEIIFSIFDTVSGDELDFKVSSNGAQATVEFDDDTGTILTFEWTDVGPFFRGRINETFRFDGIFLHEIRTGLTASAMVSGTITVESLGLSTEFEGAFGEIIEASSGLLTITQQ